MRDRIRDGMLWIKDRQRRIVIFVGYSLFGLLMLASFLYLTFPFDLLASKWVLSLEKQSGCKIQVGEKRFHFPLRSVWTAVQVACPGPARPPWKIELIDLSVAPFPLLWDRRGEIDYEIKLAGGAITGRLRVVQRPEGLSFSLKKTGKRLQLVQLLGVDGGWSGLLDLNGEGSWSNRDIWKGSGSLTFTLEALRIDRINEIGKWAVPIGALSFSTAQGRLQWRNGTFTIEQLTAQGTEADLVSGGGTFFVKEPVEESLVNLTFKIAPKGDFKQIAMMFAQGDSGQGPLTLRVTGPLSRPQISINGRPFNR